MPKQPDIQALFEQSLQHWQAERFEQTEMGMNKVLALNPNHVGANQILGQLAAHFGKLEIASQLLHKVVANAPNYAEGYRLLAQAQYELRQFDAARVNLNKALELDPDNVIAKNMRTAVDRDRQLATDSDYGNQDNKPWRETDAVWEEFAGNSTVLVAFSGFGVNDGLPTFMFHKFLGNYSEIDKLFVRDVSCSWYLQGLNGISTDIETTAEFIGKKLEKYQRKIFLGCSSGGTAAILFGELLGADKVIAFSPQVVLTETEKNAISDNRWSRMLKHVEAGIADARHMNLTNLNPFKADIDIFYGDRRRLDRLHAEMVQGDLVTRIPCDSDQHIISVQLRDSGELKIIVDNAIVAKPA